jgi:hypothetical protein
MQLILPKSCNIVHLAQTYNKSHMEFNEIGILTRQKLGIRVLAKKGSEQMCITIPISKEWLIINCE